MKNWNGKATSQTAPPNLYLEIEWPQTPARYPYYERQDNASIAQPRVKSGSRMQADRVSFGFRKCRSVADAIQQCNTALAQKSCAAWILEGDIKGCYDNINHDWLLEHIPMDKRILKQWLKSGYMERGRYYDTVIGTPQGGIASPILANMALDGLEKILNRPYGRLRPSGKWIFPANGHKVNLCRYADDFIITANSKEVLEQEIKPLLQQFLAERGLSLSEEKTRILTLRMVSTFWESIFANSMVNSELNHRRRTL